ncbi:MAG: DUF3575 domain-containing protein [Bacteroidia bacterium]|nr:DUF3575 domain-containing protein [Bacteroidia bacterium]
MFALFNLLTGHSQAQYNSHYNIVKVTPIKLGLQRALAFSYERVLKDQHSVGMGFSGVFPWNALNTAGLIGIESSGENWAVDEFRFSGFTLSPEYRFYLLEDAPENLYAGVFGRYFQYNAETSVNIELGGSTPGDLQADFRFRGLGLGLEVGYQKIWKSGFTFDYHLGLGLTGAGLNLRGQLNNVLPDQIGTAIDEVNQFLDQIPILNVALPDQDNFNIRTPVASGPWPVLRGSLSLGYAF